MEVNTIEQNILVKVRNVRKWYPAGGGFLRGGKLKVRAVDDVSFDIRRGETLGVVGESGCGKTTLGKAILGLEELDGGSVMFDGRTLFKSGRRKMLSLRREMQFIFQDPRDSLNPRMTIGKSISEPLVVHRVGDRLARKKRVAELLENVGLSQAQTQRFPHELSGGQLQRVGIARALALNPKLIVCDEPVSALDVSIQSQILNLLSDLRRQFKLTYLFIAHELSVVKHISDRVAVMYLGKIVELADKHEIYSRAEHPYTQALISTIPIPDPTASRKRTVLEGEVPSPINPPSGCRFHTRCPLVDDICDEIEPPLVNIGAGHWLACHRHPFALKGFKSKEQK